MKLPENEDEVLILHNPRCSKSRQAVALLGERGVPFQERLYLEDQLSREELEELGRRLDRPPSEWVRRGQTEFKTAGLSRDSADDAILAAMVAAPILVERPIVIRGRRARVGRPPEDVLALFE